MAGAVFVVFSLVWGKHRTIHPLVGNVPLIKHVPEVLRLLH